MTLSCPHCTEAKRNGRIYIAVFERSRGVFAGASVCSYCDCVDLWPNSDKVLEK